MTIPLIYFNKKESNNPRYIYVAFQEDPDGRAPSCSPNRLNLNTFNVFVYLLSPLSALERTAWVESGMGTEKKRRRKVKGVGRVLAMYLCWASLGPGPCSILLDSIGYILESGDCSPSESHHLNLEERWDFWVFGMKMNQRMRVEQNLSQGRMERSNKINTPFPLFPSLHCTNTILYLYLLPKEQVARIHQN